MERFHKALTQDSGIFLGILKFGKLRTYKYDESGQKLMEFSPDDIPCA
jgi:hypothetical protein